MSLRRRKFRVRRRKTSVVACRQTYPVFSLRQRYLGLIPVGMLVYVGKQFPDDPEDQHVIGCHEKKVIRAVKMDLDFPSGKSRGNRFYEHGIVFPGSQSLAEDRMVVLHLFSDPGIQTVQGI